MRRLAMILLGLCVVALPGILLQPAHSLRVTTGEDELVLCSRVTPGTLVTLEYTHSMYGGFVREVYRVTADGTLERERFVTENAAAAEYYATDGRTMHAADGYEVLGPRFITSDLTVRVDARGDHWLTIGSTHVHLAEILPGSTQVHLYDGRRPCP